jgi:dinuclear metal center YbgI/SA1388 family protein
MTTVADVAQLLERVAPLALAADWDNVGLLLGDPSRDVERVMTCLTVTPESASEAIREKADLIVSHHPILFRPVKTLTATTTEGRMLLALAKAGIAVYSPHTAYDDAPDGINAGLARRLGISAGPLRKLPTGDPGTAKVKIVVFVPDKDLARVSDALFKAGAGEIGNYRECSYRIAGTGTFFGTDDSNPTVGSRGRRENVEEWRLEVVCPADRLDAVLRSMRGAHSYEEPAFDVYPLVAGPTHSGQGRIGTLARPTTLAEFAELVKSTLGATVVQTVGDGARPIRTVAIACGAAGEFLKDAIRKNADVFLTGELRFHEALAAQASGIAVVLPGHFATERPGVEDLAARIGAELPSLAAWPSRDERDPLR